MEGNLETEEKGHMRETTALLNNENSVKHSGNVVISGDENEFRFLNSEESTSAGGY